MYWRDTSFSVIDCCIRGMHTISQGLCIGCIFQCHRQNFRLVLEGCISQDFSLCIGRMDLSVIDCCTGVHLSRLYWRDASLKILGYCVWRDASLKALDFVLERYIFQCHRLLYWRNASLKTIWERCTSQCSGLLYWRDVSYQELR